MLDALPEPPSEPDMDEPEGTPRWVYVFVIGIVVLVLGFVTLHLLGGGFPAHTMP